MLQRIVGGVGRAADIIFPHQCVACRSLVEVEGGLCGACWRDMPFCHGLVCDACGIPLPGEDGGGVHCDACLREPRAWDRARAAALYAGTARRVVLALKHGDRLDLVKPAARWMAQAGGPVLTRDALLVPVPVHWRRLFKRRYNQAALLGREIARQEGLSQCPDALLRHRYTGSQEGKGHEARHANVAAAIAVHPRRAGLVAGRDIVLIDDVLTSGATLAACAEALREAGAQRVDALVLARVGRDA